MYLWGKTEEPIPCGYLETELNATGIYYFLCCSRYILFLCKMGRGLFSTDSWNVGHGPMYLATISRSSPDVSMEQV